MSIPRIQTLRAREILDSRGHPTVEVTVMLSDGDHATASVPSGASTGQFEALELRDDDASRFNGKGVLRACEHVNGEILPKLRGMRISDQREIDDRMLELDGTPNKARLGANALLGVSLACARAGSVAARLPLYRYLRTAYDIHGDDDRLPEPMINIFNGGLHALNGLDFQEYLIIPHGKTFAKRLQTGAEIYAALAKVLKKAHKSTLVGDEGGFAPSCESNREPLTLIARAISQTAYELGTSVHVGLDVASSVFFDPTTSRYELKNEKRVLTRDELLAYYLELTQEFPFLSIEDGMADVDEPGWTLLTKQLGQKQLIIGDDLFVTNVTRLEHGIEHNLANAILVKPNQIGTLSETIDAIRLAQHHEFVPVISHRSGETNDTFIADLAVAVSAPYIKTGSVSRGERVAKYNRLLAIESELA